MSEPDRPVQPKEASHARRGGPPQDEPRVRQAVVIVHGMGEQRPLETLSGFVEAALPPLDDRQTRFYSRPDKVTDSYESRRYLAPRYPESGPEQWAQTEFFEYHWAHHMQGNRLGDLWPTFRKMLLQFPWRVPAGLRGVWLLFWAILGWVVWALWRGPLSGLDLTGGSLNDALRTVLGGGVVAVVLTFLVTRVLPSRLSTSFGDVVRYLDTSPRSYEARRLIRKGMIDLLQGLHDANRYQRVIVVGHSLGAYIAYDGIAFLWTRLNKLHDGEGKANGVGEVPRGLRDVEEMASALVSSPSDEARDALREAQRALWEGSRLQGNPWLITDFITVGTPMAFADLLYTRSRAQFEARVDLREFPICPPLSDQGPDNNIHGTDRWYSWNNHGRRVVYEGAPFAVVRWTNLWFPAALWFFGDWFGGPLGPLFGPGIQDMPLRRNLPWRWVPGYAHSLYFPLRDSQEGSARAALRQALDLPATHWLSRTRGAPRPDPRTGLTTEGSALLPRQRSLLEQFTDLGARLFGTLWEK
jgi:hypothetical protein